MPRTFMAATLALLSIQCLCFAEKTDRSKAVLALPAVINHATCDLSWNLSDEMTTTLGRSLEKKGIYLVKAEKLKEQNPFGPNLGWLKRAYPNQEFVAFVEIIKHDEEFTYPPTKISPAESPAELKTSVRLRLIDLRSEHPIVILQELLHHNYSIAKQFTRVNFHQMAWQEEGFSISPLGLAHEELSSEIANRIESYLSYAKAE